MLAALYWALGRPHPCHLAIGPFFCATYDFLMATYFYTRRNHWRAAWSAIAAVMSPRKNRQ